MKETELARIVSATDQYMGRGIYASIHAVQARTEILQLAAHVQRDRPKVIVEIGTHKGGTLFIWCRSNPQAELIVSIDLPGGEYGGGYEKRRCRLYREFVRDQPHTEIHFVRADSHARETVTQLASYLRGRPIDFLYIDGDHTYEGVRRDYEMYGPLVRPDGLIAFHDICTVGDQYGTSRFWTELKSTHRHCEYVRPARKKMGLGVVFAKSAVLA